MAVVIRLARGGSKKKPHYRIVAADSRKRRDGRFIEILGYYTPQNEENQYNLKEDRINEWLKKGAKPSETVKSLLKKANFFEKSNTAI
ncbi:MAG: 30S ribosomal protein S16 [Candidatus Schekmanbacteria bacterium]|nr:MAG: 30S ribosomal protein S16 [Candidatus Schekmanbacteria bacterium]